MRTRHLLNAATMSPMSPKFLEVICPRQIDFYGLTSRMLQGWPSPNLVKIELEKRARFSCDFPALDQIWVWLCFTSDSDPWNCYNGSYLEIKILSYHLMATATFEIVNRSSKPVNQSTLDHYEIMSCIMQEFAWQGSRLYQGKTQSM